jgi:aminoglycoside phosphotransferase (APT) family kinase protein
MYREMIRVLAKLHSVDYKAIGLSDFGAPFSYAARQVHTWSRQVKLWRTYLLLIFD